MKIFRTNQIKELDAYTIAHEPIASFDLMKRASSVLFNELLHALDRDAFVRVVAGPGNNGGDALVVARMLAMVGFRLETYLFSTNGRYSADCLAAKAELEAHGETVHLVDESSLADFSVNASDCVLDGLFGSGLNRPLEGFYADVVRLINESGATVFSIDVPSGLFGEDNRTNRAESIVRATVTYTFQFPKIAFLLYENASYVGDVHVLDIQLHPKGMEEIPSSYFLFGKEEATQFLHRRTKFSHKGTYGHALLVAGSYGMVGAALLGAKAALRTGCGLLTVHVPSRCCDVLQISVPEAIASLDADETAFGELPDLSRFNAVGVGPGLGRKAQTHKALSDLIENVRVPLVMDADALNIVAEEGWLSRLPKNTIITPHPKEFDRLAGDSVSGYDRLEKQIRLSQEYGLIIVLKGANTSVSLPDGRCFFNTSGNPGMATAGSGDTLTGIILSLLAQNYTAEQAALLGVYLHGLAGDLAAEEISQESLLAGDIANYIGKAYRFLQVR
ncbi:MAG: NAD(P)H-hydrate dehydratase [Paludibacteraceae bacterium]|nr:NAD(P)H-hydrate dehydratase [Paludibacteraceae bacterium]